MGKSIDDYDIERYDPAREESRRARRAPQAIDNGGAVTVDPWLDRLTFILDQAIRVPGTNIRFGLDPIISLLLPAFGDSISTLMSIYIVIVSVRYGLPKSVIARMVFNIGADFLIGSVPLVGDLFDFAWKANKKNLNLLNRHALGEGRSKWSDWGWLFLLIGVLGLVVLGLLAVLIYAVRLAGLQMF
jgi:hypothetical protein